MNSYTKLLSYISSMKDQQLSGKLKNLYTYIQDTYPSAAGAGTKHQARSGGYMDHICECLDIGKTIYEEFCKKRKLDFTFDDVILVILLHDIEKPIKQAGDVNDRSSMQIRLDIMNDYDIQLNEQQMNALTYIHGEGNDYHKTNRIMNPLAAFCHIIDTTSARIFYDEPKKSGSWQ